jgi:hypothetical protein
MSASANQSWSSRKLILPWKARVRAALLFIACTVGIVALCVWLFGFLMPWLSSHRSGGYERERALLEQQARIGQIDEFWQGKVPLLRLAAALGLALFGAWGAYRIFMFFARDLDESGRWDRLIADRRSRYHR